MFNIVEKGNYFIGILFKIVMRNGYLMEVGGGIKGCVICWYFIIKDWSKDIDKEILF